MYVQLVTLFRRRIETEEWPVGERIPTLTELIDELGVARVTVRHAVGLLEEEGLIGRYRGRGTFVLKQPESTIWYRIPTSWDQLVNTTPDIEFEWLEAGPSEHVPRPFHGKGAVAPAYHYMRRRLLRHHVPYCIGTTYIEKTIFDEIGKDAFDAPVPVQVLNAHLGDQISSAEQTVRAGAADLSTAAQLGLHVNAPLMIVTRSIIDRSGILVYESMGAFRGDFVEIHADLR